MFDYYANFHYLCGAKNGAAPGVGAIIKVPMHAFVM